MKQTRKHPDSIRADKIWKLLVAERKRRILAEKFHKADEQDANELSERLYEIYNQLSPRHPEGGSIEYMIEQECADWTELRDLLKLPSTDNDRSAVIEEIKRLQGWAE